MLHLQGIIVADTGNNRLVLAAQNGSIALLAGNGGVADSNGFATSNGVAAPQRMAATPTGGILVTTANGVRLLQDGNLSTLAGSSAAGLVDGLGNIATFFGPSSIGVVNSSYLMVGDGDNKVIRGMTFNASLNKWLVTTVSLVQSKIINGVAYLSNFLYFIVDTSNEVSSLSLATGEEKVYCGQGGGGTTDGACTSAKFQNLQDLAVDANDNLVVLSKNSVRVINTTTRVTRFVAGAGAGLADGLGATAKFNGATAITVDLLTGAAQHC